MKYNCPDCLLNVTDCEGCHRVMNRPSNIYPPQHYIDEHWLDTTYKFGFNNEACQSCSNNPKNGGSGICNCTIPYLSGQGVTYCTTQDTNTVSTGQFSYVGKRLEKEPESVTTVATNVTNSEFITGTGSGAKLKFKNKINNKE